MLSREDKRIADSCGITHEEARRILLEEARKFDYDESYKKLKASLHRNPRFVSCPSAGLFRP